MFKSDIPALRWATIAILLMAASAAFASTRTYSSIEKMGGWQSCGACAGKAGAGPVVPFSMKQGISSPSMDGSSAQFTLGGSHPYSNALWWKQLGANSSATHFTYDVYYYVKNPSAAQALEFDVNQSLGGKKYIFGTECDFNGTHTWHVYNASAARWVSTSVGCSRPAAYSWQHIVLQFVRANGQMHFVSVSVNGQTHYFNRSYSPRASGANEINVAFQMDGNGSQTNYQVWLDHVKLTYY